MVEVGYVYAVAGRKQDAERLLRLVEDDVKRGSAPANYPAFIYVGLGRRDEALASLEAAFNPQTGWAPYGISQWTLFESLTEDPRYQNLLLRMKEMRLARSVEAKY